MPAEVVDGGETSNAPGGEWGANYHYRPAADGANYHYRPAANGGKLPLPPGGGQWGIPGRQNRELPFMRMGNKQAPA